MAKIDDIIRDIEQLLSSADQSNTPRGRQLAEIYAAACNDVNNTLSECRNLFRMGAYSEARKLNTRATPSLVERYRILNFAHRKEWLQLCNLYAWSIPPELDEEIVLKLESTEDEKVELTITELQDQWRRIIRDGSLREKLILARKIYALDSSSVWRSNLLNVERPWINALKKEADDALAEGRANDLAELYKELISPDLIQPLPPSSLSKYQELVNRHSREKIDLEKKTLLEEISSCYAAMLLPELEDALSRWSSLESNPLFSCTKEEQIQISDAKTFLLNQQAAANAKELFNSLQNKLEQLLNEDTAPEEIDSVYHSLQQLDYPLKPLLEDRMNDFYIRLELETKRRHVRRCLYWGLSVVLLAAIIFTAIFLVQHEWEYQQASAKIRTLIDNRQFESALEYYRKIVHERPTIAARPGIEALRKEVEEKRAEFYKIQETFDETCNTLESQYLTEANVLDPIIPKLMEELETRAESLPEAQNARMIALQQKYADLKKRVLDNFEFQFRKDANEIVTNWNDFFKAFSKLTNEEAEKQVNGLRAKSTEVLHKHQARIRSELYKEWDTIFSDYYTKYEQDKKSREEALKRTRNLFYPTSLTVYARALKEIESESKELHNSFQIAEDQVADAETLENPYKSRSLLMRIIEQFQRNPYCRDIKAMETHPDKQSGWIAARAGRLRELKDNELEKHYKVYELILRNGVTRYHFYLSDIEKDLYLEKSWADDWIKALRITFIQADNGVQSNIVMQNLSPRKKRNRNKKTDVISSSSMNSDTGKTELYVVPGQKFQALPEKLTIESETFLKNPGTLQLSAQYAVLKTLLTSLESSTRSRDVLIAIKTVVEDQTLSNVYAKVHLLKQLFSLLPTEGVIPYHKHLQGLSDLLMTYSSDSEKKRWQDPSATHKNPLEAAAFPGKLEELNLKEEISALIFSELLLEQAVLHYPIPVGVLYHNDAKNNWRLHAFDAWKKTLMQNETAFVLSHTGELQNCYAFDPRSLIAELPETEISDALRKALYNGQIVYVNFNLNTWHQEFQKAELQLEKLGFSLPRNTGHIIWPAIWPANMRDLTELKKK